MNETGKSRKDNIVANCRISGDTRSIFVQKNIFANVFLVIISLYFRQLLRSRLDGRYIGREGVTTEQAREVASTLVETFR